MLGFFFIPIYVHDTSTEVTCFLSSVEVKKSDYRGLSGGH